MTGKQISVDLTDSCIGHTLNHVDVECSKRRRKLGRPHDTTNIHRSSSSPGPRRINHLVSTIRKKIQEVQDLMKFTGLKLNIHKCFSKAVAFADALCVRVGSLHISL